MKKKITKNNIKSFLKSITSFIIKYKYLVILAIPFISMDIITRLFCNSIKYYKIYRFTPNMFTLAWTFLFLSLSLCFKKKIGKIIYIFINIIFLIMFLTNNVYYSMTKTIFDFNLVESAKEGSSYIFDAIKNCNPLVYVAIVFIIITIIIALKHIPNKENNNYKSLGICITIFVLLHILIPYSLGKPNKSLTWSSWKNPRNIYISFNDSNKSMRVSGLYEYVIRNFYVTFFKVKETESEEDIAFLDSAFAEAKNTENSYTGIFKDKNIIFIQFEGLDNWLLNEVDTPTIYSMLNNSIVFNNHYSYYNGGGSTFNSEFAVNTGFITPLSYTQNAYTFNKNKFPYSMAKIFKSLNYSVNAFHMNTGEFYSRTTNYKNWGYDKYYGLKDVFKYTDDSYTLDRELILNEAFNELLLPTDKKFVDYLITYSGHLPFNNNKGVCKLLYDIDHTPEETEEDIENESTEEVKDKEIEVIVEREPMTEEECIRRQAKETDYMMELLLQSLEEKGLIDNTIIIAYSDHYLYTIEDKSILDRYKETSNNLINKTPFFIWSKDMNQVTINKVTSQLNILPTTLNLMGISYNPNNYIGTDALDPNYDGIVFFSDYSWYNGTVYVENGEVTNNKSISSKDLEYYNNYISEITKKNDLALKYNYFKNKKTN